MLYDYYRSYNNERSRQLKKNVKDLLKIGDSCLFLVNPYIHWAGENECEDGHVSAICEDGDLLHYMYGVSSYSDIVKFEDIMIIGDPDNSELGEQFKISGFQKEELFSIEKS